MVHPNRCRPVIVKASAKSQTRIKPEFLGKLRDMATTEGSPMHVIADRIFGLGLTVYRQVDADAIPAIIDSPKAQTYISPDLLQKLRDIATAKGVPTPVISDRVFRLGLAVYEQRRQIDVNALAIERFIASWSVPEDKAA